MELNVDTIIYFIRIFVLNIYVFYCFNKICNTDSKIINNIIIAISNVIMVLCYICIRDVFKSFLPFIILCLLYGIIISRVTKNKLGFTLLVTLISYALLFLFQGVSTIIQFIPYKLLYKIFGVESRLLSLSIILVLQFVLLYYFFKIKRFRNGFSFVNNKLNNEVTDIIMINISTLVLLIYCLTGTYHDEITRNFFMTFSIIAIIMLFTIQKMLTMYYKQKLLVDTIEEYKAEVQEKQNEIDKLKNDKQSISKITHDFYNRQKALELLVISNMNLDNIDKENTSPSVLKIVEDLTSEYSQRFESVKELPKLAKTEIMEIDNMFSYMQSECVKSNIDFKLKVTGNIHSLINNIIPKNKLETLIGDHLRDAINAVNLEEVENKEILAIIGIKNNKYEFSVFDTGIDFKIDTLLKLGIEPTTTNKEKGGTGTGFMTTFDTLKETKASLIITEYPTGSNGDYTKCVTIRFDGKGQYKICSHRDKEIKNKAKDGRIKIEKLK